MRIRNIEVLTLRKIEKNYIEREGLNLAVSGTIFVPSGFYKKVRGRLDPKKMF